MNHLHDPKVISIITCLLLQASALAADAPAPSDPSATLANPLAAWPIDRLSATRERPLFAPTRRPPPPPPPPPLVREVAAPPKPPPSLTVLGIVTEADGARAMVRTQASDRVVRARIGDDVAGWTVTQIEARRVVLTLDDRSVSYALFERTGAKTATRPPAEPEPAAQSLAQERTERRSSRR